MFRLPPDGVCEFMRERIIFRVTPWVSDRFVPDLSHFE